MDYQVSWSPEAWEDVEAIAAYIQKNSPLHAQKIIEEPIAASRGLTRFPTRGRGVPELPSYRECFIYSYRMIYRVDDRRVLLVAVIHGRRLLESVERFTS